MSGKHFTSMYQKPDYNSGNHSGGQGQFEDRIIMKSKLTKESLVVVSPNQVSADLPTENSTEVVILDLKDGIYYELRDVGARIWELIQQPCSVAAILDKLLAEYDVTAPRCEADLLALLEDMSEHDLIEISDAPYR